MTNLSPDNIIKVFTTLVRLILEYTCELRHSSLNVHQRNQIESIQECALNMAHPLQSYEEALQANGRPIRESIKITACWKLFTAMQDSEHKLHCLLPPMWKSHYNSRQANVYPLPSTRTTRYKDSFIPFCLFNFWLCVSPYTYPLLCLSQSVVYVTCHVNLVLVILYIFMLYLLGILVANYFTTNNKMCIDMLDPVLP